MTAVLPFEMQLVQCSVMLRLKHSLQRAWACILDVGYYLDYLLLRRFAVHRDAAPMHRGCAQYARVRIQSSDR